MSEAAQPEFGVYVHWPFCARICPYCDFNVYRDRGVDAARWAAAIESDLSYWASLTPRRRVSSLYFGGGTPSLAPISVIERVVAACDRHWGFAADPEITLEANPTDAEIGRFRSFAAAGVNRLSLGVQSLDDAALRFLGRDHDAASAMRAIETALSAFPRANADLIYARPGQTVSEWELELGRAMASGLKHISLYQLTIEPGTAFERAVSRKRWAPADDDVSADLFDATQALTAAAGLPAYEISNHAQAGDVSRHNLLYWRQRDYVGVGPGAHGRVTIDGTRRATETALRPQDYLECVERDGCGAVVDEPLTDDEMLVERLAMGLRTLEGVPLTPAEFERLGEAIDDLSRRNLMTVKDARLYATASGRRILNSVLVELAP